MTLVFILGLYLSYYWTMQNHAVDLLGYGAARGEFVRNFFERRQGSDTRVAALFLGDALAQTSFNPKFLHRQRSVNLAISGGNAMTSIITYKKFIDFEDPPACVFYASLYGSERKYEAFFDKIVRFNYFNLKDLSAVWREASAGQVFPATDFSYFSYLWESLVYKLKLDDVPLTELRAWLFRNQSVQDGRSQRAIAYTRNHNGFLSLKDNNDVSDEEMSPDSHRFFTKSFKKSAPEDYYLKKLAFLAATSGAHFYYVLLPVAQSDNLGEAQKYLDQRERHIRSVLATSESTSVLQPFRSLKPELMRDFVHPNIEGVRKVMHELERLAPHCRDIDDEEG